MQRWEERGREGGGGTETQRPKETSAAQTFSSGFEAGWEGPRRSCLVRDKPPTPSRELWALSGPRLVRAVAGGAPARVWPSEDRGQSPSGTGLGPVQTRLGATRLVPRAPGQPSRWACDPGGEGSQGARGASPGRTCFCLSTTARPAARWRPGGPPVLTRPRPDGRIERGQGELQGKGGALHRGPSPQDKQLRVPASHPRLCPLPKSRPRRPPRRCLPSAPRRRQMAPFH